MGAEGFEMGTAFMVASETLVHPNVKKAVMDGDMEDSAVMAGQIAALIKKEKPAADIIDDALKEAKDYS